MKKLIYLLVLIITFSSCKKEDPIEPVPQTTNTTVTNNGSYTVTQMWYIAIDDAYCGGDLSIPGVDLTVYLPTNNIQISIRDTVVVGGVRNFDLFPSESSGQYYVVDTTFTVNDLTNSSSQANIWNDCTYGWGNMNGSVGQDPQDYLTEPYQTVGNTRVYRDTVIISE